VHAVVRESNEVQGENIAGRPLLITLFVRSDERRMHMVSSPNNAVYLLMPAPAPPQVVR